MWELTPLMPKELVPAVGMKTGLACVLLTMRRRVSLRTRQATHMTRLGYHDTCVTLGRHLLLAAS